MNRLSGSIDGPIRRLFLLICVLTLVVITGAAPVAAEDLSFTFNDPVGDVTTAPDIGEVNVLWSDTGDVTFEISISNQPSLVEGDWIEVSLDTDRDGISDVLFHYGRTVEPHQCYRTGPSTFTCDTAWALLDYGYTEGVLALVVDGLGLGIDEGGFSFRVTGYGVSPFEVDIGSIWTVALVDNDPPVIYVGIDPLRIWAQSPAGSVFNYFAIVRAVDAVDTDPVLECAPPPDHLFPIGDTVVSCTATDYWGNSATRAFTITVLGSEEVLDDLLGFIDTIDPQVGKSLSAKISNAVAAMNASRTKAACGMLGAFVNEVDAQAGKALVGPYDDIILQNYATHVAANLLLCDS